MTQHSGPVGIGIIGTGVISTTYLENLTAMPDVVVHALGDRSPEAAATRAAEFGIANHGGPEVVLDHPEIEIVVNLTIPQAHAPVALQTLAAVKHAYCEKPLATSLEAGREVLAAAQSAGLRVGCAPDTFLGEGVQAALRLVNDPQSGRVLDAVASFTKPGPELWHPNPEFLFTEGGGPLLDDGPYYLTTLVQAMGSATSVTAIAATSRSSRTIATGPRAGTEFAVTVPTYHAYQLQFASGAVAVGSFSFDSPAYTSTVELTTMNTAIRFPNPNQFDGAVQHLSYGDAPTDWTSNETTAKATRGTGVLEMARALRAGQPHRASGEVALHVLEIMTATAEAAQTGRAVPISSSVSRVAPLPLDWDPFARTL